MKRIITFGEIMLRLNPAGYTRFVQANADDLVDAFGMTFVTDEVTVYASGSGDLFFVTDGTLHLNSLG